MKAAATFKPILFSTAMVKAILDGRKTQTRRIVKPPFQQWLQESYGDNEWSKTALNFSKIQVGDILWVRETWNTRDAEFVYKASPDLFKQTRWYKEIEKVFTQQSLEMPEPENCIKWKPSIHMPKDACRLFLRVTDVIRIERLQDISEQDALAEGIKRFSKAPIYGYQNYLHQESFCITAKESFQTLWQKINGINSWNENPFVWVYSFNKITTPSNFLTQ